MKLFEHLGNTAEPLRLTDEEIVLQVPGGRSVKALLNATPVQSQEGVVESFVVTLQDMTPLEELERLRAESMGMVSHESGYDPVVTGEPGAADYVVKPFSPTELAARIRSVLPPALPTAS